MAQTSVQVYGVLDAGLSRVTGMLGGRQNALVSGIMDGSRLGFKGSEDLGGGYRALFALEHRIEVDTGVISNRPGSGSQLPDRLSRAELLSLFPALQPAVTGVANNIGATAGVNLDGRFWDRQIYLGLVTPVGAVLAGRQYTPGYEVAATFDTLETQSSLSAGQVGSFPPTVDIRVSNALAYRIVVGPVSAALMGGLKEGSTSTGNFYGGNVIYKTEAFAVGVGYNQRDNELGQKSLTTTLVGASAKVGPGTVVGQFTTIKDDHPTGLSSIVPSLTPLTGAATRSSCRTPSSTRSGRTPGSITSATACRWPATSCTWPATSTIAAGRTRTPRPSALSSHSFSARTDLNLVMTRFVIKNLAQPHRAGRQPGGVTASAAPSNAFAIGMRHRFDQLPTARASKRRRPQTQEHPWHSPSATPPWRSASAAFCSPPVAAVRRQRHRHDNSGDRGACRPTAAAGHDAVVGRFPREPERQCERPQPAGRGRRPKCGVDFSLQYGTVGAKGEKTNATGALMVPVGTDSACTGARPIVLYAHGTTTGKNYNIANVLDSTNPAYSEALLVAAMYAAQGFIVVAPNYAGYDTSTLGYHPYLVADQQSKDMIDALTAARKAIPRLAAADSGKLFITGYSQGGHVAMATHKALQAAGSTVTASAPMSGPYALAAFGDAVYYGNVNLGSTIFTPLLINAFQNAYGNIYSSLTDVYSAPYATGIDTLLPSLTSVTTLIQQGRLPQTAMFSNTPPTAPAGAPCCNRR
jgi:predicted porin